MMPFFTIVVPTLNEENYLPKLLKDLTKQNYKDFEVVIVDGGSEDNTKKNTLPFKTKLELTFYTVNKRNVSYQRNFGASKATGKYLIFLDADSRVTASFLSKLKKYIETKKGLVFLPYVDPEENTSQIKAFYQFVNFIIDISQNMGRPLSSVGSMVWERNFFHAVGGFDEKVYVAEDFNIVQKAHKWGVHAKFMPHIKVKFSFRRIKKEGSLKSIYKMLLGTIYFMFKGEIKKKIYDYEMGGQIYKKDPVKRVKSDTVSFNQLTTQLQHLFTDVFKE